MAVKLNVPITITGTNKADAAFKSATDGAKQLANVVTALSTGYLALSDIMGKVADLASVPLKAALDAEEASVKLAASLKIAGQYSEENMQKIDNFASVLQKFTGLEDDATKSVVASNAAMLGNVKNAVALTRASAILAKTQRIDVAQANQMLVASLNGNARALAIVAPQLKSVSEEALRAGYAVRFFADKYEEMLTADQSSSGGALVRLKRQFEDIMQAIGEALLEGFDLPGKYEEISSLFEQINQIIATNREVFVEWGAFVSDTLTDVLKFGVGILREMAPEMVKLTRTIVDLLKLAMFPLVDAFTTFGIVYGGITSNNKLVKMFIELREAGRSMAKNALFDAIIGPMLPPEMGIPEEYRPGAGYTPPRKTTPGQMPKGDDFVDPKLPKTARQQEEATREAEKMAEKRKQAWLDYQRLTESLHDQMAEADASAGNEILRQHLLRKEQLGRLEVDQYAKQKELLDKGIIDKGQMINRDLALMTNFHNLEVALSNKTNREITQLRNEQRLELFRITGRTHAVINLQAEMEKQALRKKLADELEIIKQYNADNLAAGIKAREAYASAMQAIDEKAEEDKSQTTGDANLDNNISKTTALISSAKSGINGIIGQIGSMFGPWGNLVAGIIQFFNMSREEFAGMIQNLTEGLGSLFDNVFDNIAVLFERFPELVQTIFSRILNINWWGHILSSLWHGLIKMFQNFWKVLFQGGKIEDGLKQVKQKEVFKGFGNEDPNAGDDEFKIKDFTKAQAHRARADDFQDQFSDAVDEGGKSFGYYISQAFKDALKWLQEVGDKFLGWLNDCYDKTIGAFIAGMDEWGLKISNWGKKMWDGFAEAALKAKAKAEEIGGQIAEGFKKMGGAIADMFKTLGGNMATGFKEAVKGWNKFFEGLGDKISDGFFDAVDKAKTTIGNIGSSIWTGMKSAWSDARDWIAGWGGTIWENMKSAWSGAGDWIAGWGGTIWENMKSAWSNSGDWIKGWGGSIWNGFKEALEAGWEWIKSLFSGLFPGGSGSGSWHGSDWIPFNGKNKGGLVLQSEMLHFARGGLVPGSGFGDTVPTMLTPGERVLNRAQSQALASGQMGGGSSYSFTFNVAAGASIDKDAVRAMMPQIIENLRRESRNGTLVARQQGVY